MASSSKDTVTKPDENAALDFSESRAAKKQHDKIVAWTNEQFKQMKNGRTVAERQWYLNLAFFFGRQYVQLLRPQANGVGGGVTNKLWTPPAPYYRSRPIINRIRPTIRHELAQLTNNKPNVSVVPSSSEDKDLYAAQAGEQIWDYLYTQKKVKQVIRRALWWTLVCGTGYIKTWWEPNEGPVDPLTGTKQGEICTIPETPFHVFCPDLREEELESQPYLIHATVRSQDWVQMRFQGGKALDGSPLQASNTQAQEILEQSFLNLIGTQPHDKQNNTLVLEVWVKPGSTPLFPEGAFFTMIGDKIVQGQQGWPYSHNKYPFAKFDHIPGGKFYSTSSVEDLVPLQKEYNRTRGQIIEAKNRMAKPQLVSPRGSVDASKITTEPGQMIEYTPGFEAPKPMPLTPLPNYVIEELDRILMDWNDISGQHDVSKGQAPPGVTAATAISYLQERDESKLSPTFDSLEEGIEKIAHMDLTYVRDYWDTPRIIKVTGADGSFDAMTFQGADLRDNIDVKTESGSSLPVSKAARQALIMDMMKMGFIDPQKGLEVMDIGGVNKIYEQLQVDMKQAQRENLRMSKIDEQTIQQNNEMNQQLQQMNPEHFGIDPETNMPLPPPLIIPVNTWDNHKAHIEYHNRFRKGQAFENLPDQIKNIFEAHVQQHIAALGVESVSQNPMIAGGVPPEMQAMLGQGGQEQGNSSQPGPAPMPQLNEGGGQ